MPDEEPLSRREAEVLLAYAESTYRTVTGFRRRIATAALVVAVLFGGIATWSALQWSATRAEIATVADDPLIEALGVRIPDPRPAIERGELRVRALLWGVVALGSAAAALLALVLYGLVRPAALPATAGGVGARRTPPRDPPGPDGSPGDRPGQPPM